MNPHLNLASESGNALVELAVTLPLFLLLILGTAEIANLAWASMQVNNAAHAAASYASQSRTTSAAANLANIGLAAQNEAPQLITAPSTQVTSTQFCSCAGSDGSSTSIACDSTALTNCPSPSTIEVSVQVTTQVPVSPLFHYPGLPSSYTITGRATMDVLQ
jgi:Flp pilus assembly protein TadG